MKLPIKINDTVHFRYKGGRKVKLKVTFTDDSVTIGILQTDYIGKNEEWYVGESKSFNNKEIRELRAP